VGTASRSSGAESEQVGRAVQSKRGAWAAASGRGPRAGRLSASLTQNYEMEKKTIPD
jgi:hypothetical protein